MKIQLLGTVFIGQGEGREYVERPWVKKQIQEKLGFTPYAGTLNLRLTAEGAKRRSELEKNAFLKICAAKGCCGGLIGKAQIGELQCAVVIPEVEGYPKDVLEIISWANLREKLKLRDGDEVSVMIDL